MKKILIAILLIGFFASLTGAVFAGPPPSVEGCVLRNNLTGPDWEARGLICTAAGPATPCMFQTIGQTCTTCCLIDKIYVWTGWVFTLIIALSILFALWGGFMLMTAAGEPEKVATGRKWITWAMIGIAVALVARAIPFLVAQLIS